MILGITGGVATGKTTVTAMLGTIGLHRGFIVHSISADAIARDLLDPGTALTKQVIEHFGKRVAIDDDSEIIDRPALASLVFADDSARRWLEQLLHPQIIAQLEEAGRPYKGFSTESPLDRTVFAMEIPLLFEAGLESLVDQILVTMCPLETQIARIVARREGNTRDGAILQIAAQMALEEKAARADYVIDTDQPLDAVGRDLEAIFDRLLAAGV